MRKKRFSLWLFSLTLCSPSWFACTATLQRAHIPRPTSVPPPGVAKRHQIAPSSHRVSAYKTHRPLQNLPKTQPKRPPQVVSVPKIQTQALISPSPTRVSVKTWRFLYLRKGRIRGVNVCNREGIQLPSAMLVLARRLEQKNMRQYLRLGSRKRLKRSRRSSRSSRVPSFPVVTIPMQVPAVRQAVQYFGTTRWGFSWIVLRRFSQYKHILEPIFKQQGMPLDLMMLAGNESSFVPHLRSYKQAMGMWQVMYHTGRRFGLRITPWVDERRHVEKATHAMIRYMKFLYRRYRNWPLVMAAYNCGEGCVDGIIKRCPNMDYWQMRLNPVCKMPRETRMTVPRFYALVYYWRHPERLQVKPKLLPPLQWQTVDVFVPVPLATIASVTGLPVSQIRSLNPDLSSWVTPPGQSYALRLPAPSALKMRQFLRHHGRALPLRSVAVQPTHSLAGLARAHKVPLSLLQQLNGVRDDQHLKQHRFVLVPPLQKGSVVKQRILLQKLATHAQQFRRQYPPSWLFHQWPGRANKHKKSCIQVKKTTTWTHIGRTLKLSPFLLRRLNPRVSRVVGGMWLKLTSAAKCPTFPAPAGEVG